jgi:hypothetical protein
MRALPLAFALRIATASGSPPAKRAPPSSCPPIWLLVLLAPMCARGESPSTVVALLANPISDLARVDGGFDSDYELGPEDAGSRNVLTLRPLVPLHLTRSWNLVADLRVPLISQDRVQTDEGTQEGLGDIEQTTYLVPARTRGTINWGAGLIVRMGTAADEALGAAGWGAGPAIVLVQQEERLISGLRVSQIWGEEGTDAATLEGFTTWLHDRRSVSLRLAAEYDARTHITTVPLSVDLSHLVESGGLFVNMTAGARYYVDVPENLGAWGIHLGLSCTYGKR